MRSLNHSSDARKTSRLPPTTAGTVVSNPPSSPTVTSSPLTVNDVIAPAPLVTVPRTSMVLLPVSVAARRGVSIWITGRQSFAMIRS